MLRLLRLSLFILIACFVAHPAFAAKRIALVVGNNVYENFPDFRQLKKAANDARAISQTLQGSLGFDVRLLVDSDYSELNQAIKQVEADIEPGSVVFFYFSGHGVAIDGANFLLPSDVPQPVVGEEQRLSGASFAAEQVIARFQRKGAKAVFAVLDACRDNPFESEAGKSVGGGGGLTMMDAAEGVFILFAAGVGQTALDRLDEADTNPNSVFTRNLLPLLETDGLSQVDLAKQLYSKVKKEAASVGHQQHPAYYDQIDGYISLGQAALATNEDNAPDAKTEPEEQIALANPTKKISPVGKLDPAEAKKALREIVESQAKFETSGDVPGFVAAGEKALEIASTSFGDESVEFADASNFMVAALSLANDREGAIRHARNTLRIYEEELGVESPVIGKGKARLAARLVAVKKLREADKLYTEALAVYDKKSPGNNVYIGMKQDDFVALSALYMGQAKLRLEQSKEKEAIRLSEKAQNIISAVSEENLVDHGVIYASHAAILKSTGDCEGAKAFFKKAVAAFKAVKVPTSRGEYADAVAQAKAGC